MTVALPALVGIALLSGGGFLLNEWTHGALSEATGLGHHHALDVGEYHCASHDDANHGADHMAHMHSRDDMPHDNCPGGAGMHMGGA